VFLGKSVAFPVTIRERVLRIVKMLNITIYRSAELSVLIHPMLRF
jgi:hypothetical protein